jgi:hypothetical protein
MAKLTKPPVPAKRPRAEVQEEFSAIGEEVETAKRTAEPKREELLRQQEADARAAVEGISVDGVVQQVSGLSLEISLERKRAQDKYDEEVRTIEKKNKEQQETLEKDWNRREAELKEREEELARLRKESQEFAARLRSESEQAAAQATKAAEARFEQQTLILKKDAEADKRVADLRIKALEETIAGQAAQVASLQKQLDQAKQQVQEIALQAIEGASGAKALAHINQIAMEQAKPRSAQN